MRVKTKNKCIKKRKKKMTKEDFIITELLVQALWRMRDN